MWKGSPPLGADPHTHGDHVADVRARALGSVPRRRRGHHRSRDVRSPGSRRESVHLHPRFRLDLPDGVARDARAINPLPTANRANPMTNLNVRPSSSRDSSSPGASRPTVVMGHAASRSSGGSVCLRGTAITPVRPFIDQYFGPGGWTRYLDVLEGPARATFDQTVTPLGWYPFDVALDLVDGLAKLGEGRPGVLREFAAYNLDYATNFIFRAIFKLGTPQFMVGRSDQVWKRFYSHGRMECDAAAGRARVRLYEFPYANANYKKLVGHSIEAVLNKAGATSLRTRYVESVVMGDEFSQYCFDWQ
jgi:hypothetical protein